MLHFPRLRRPSLLGLTGWLALSLEALLTLCIAASSLPVRDGATPQSEWGEAPCDSGKESGRSLVVLGFLLELGSSLFVLFTDLVELFHVLKEVRASLEGDEELGLLGVTTLGVAPVARGLNCDGLGSDLLECSVVVSKDMSVTPTRRLTLSDKKQGSIEKNQLVIAETHQ